MSSVNYIYFFRSPHPWRSFLRPADAKCNSHKKHSCARQPCQTKGSRANHAQFQAYQTVTSLKTILTPIGSNSSRQSPARQRRG